MMAEIVEVRDVKTYKPRLVVTSKNYIGSTKQIFLVESEETRGGALSCIHKMKICMPTLSR
ncbi:unnamed protein product [Acanthoscelides obtectus]|uniref:Uncharacterized protein n=1 Tax=Acanthoscelides obtectus TaxID=200917 RepID=A0A9P0PN16_ACAOB|nr:unnamed protein product [Acanthoscelides obtectus]CAK1653824.1 hypothetical protein AOBTE_LOCUS18374 [Acanthoscelides obtectus]